MVYTQNIFIILTLCGNYWASGCQILQSKEYKDWFDKNGQNIH